eukprot:scaffold110413_cov28-Tisochrysis_lutea.AAC.2
MYGISDDKFAEVCVIVDKLDKIGPDETVALLLEKDVRGNSRKLSITPWDAPYHRPSGPAIWAVLSTASISRPW